MNDHMTHIEDLILTNGVEGAKTILRLMTLISEGRANITVKWDGSPSIFAGTDKQSGRFFVATKSIFNKSPTLFTDAESIIDQTKSQGLAEKLQACLKYLPSLNITGVLQGDFLFQNKDIKLVDSHHTFHPNTIVYGLESHPNAEIGVAWHTHYSADKVTYGIQPGMHEQSDDILCIDTNTMCDGGYVPALNTDYLYLSFVQSVSDEPLIRDVMLQYENVRVRNCISWAGSAKYLTDLDIWVQDKYQKLIESRKTPAGKNTQAQNLTRINTFLSCKHEMRALILFQYEVVLAKLIVINRFEMNSNVKTMVLSNNEYHNASHEGYVIIDGCDAYKFVDREVFSHYNFSPNITKGWDAPTRT